MKTVNNKHNEFVKSLRNIMKTENKKRDEPQRNSDDEKTQRLQEFLETKFEELFGPKDTNDD